jgi:hypothetical protein
MVWLPVGLHGLLLVGGSEDERRELKFIPCDEDRSGSHLDVGMLMNRLLSLSSWTGVTSECRAGRKTTRREEGELSQRASRVVQGWPYLIFKSPCPFRYQQKKHGRGLGFP